MKKNKLTLFLLVLSTFVWMGSIVSYTNGPPNGVSGGGPSANNCSGCHTGVVNSGTANVEITSDIPATGYQPANLYTITVSISDNGRNKFGFQVTNQIVGDTSSGGTFIITDTLYTQKATEDTYQYVMHTDTGTVGIGGNSWTYDWQAPVSGTGEIMLYASLLAANGDNKDTLDFTYTTSLSIPEFGTASIESLDNIADLSVYPTRVQDLFTVDMMIENPVELKISVSDLSGRVVYDLSDFAYTGAYQKQVSVSDWASGLYMVSISNGSQEISRKLIVQ